MSRIAKCADHVLDVVATKLGMEGRAYVNPGGSVAWDTGVCEQLVVRVIRVSPRIATDAVRSQPVGPNPMATVPGRIVRLGVQLTRCVPVVDERGRAPSPAVLHDHGTGILDDAEKIWKALLCDVDSEYRCRPLQWTGLGPEGGIAGGEWEADLDIPL